MPPRTRRPQFGVAMWGAPSSGKTTFLATLQIALTRRAVEDEEWVLTGADEASTQMLVKLTEDVTERKFPRATQGMEQYTWVLERLSERPRQWRWLQRSKPEPSAGIDLDLVDAQGAIFSGQSSRYVEGLNDLINNLQRSRGIVFLFDPIREFTRGDVFSHTNGVLSALASRMLNSSERVGGRLPHYVAVCITKFDEPKVLNTAEKMKLLTTDPADRFEFPRVADDEDAEELLGHLCGVSRTGNADLVPRTLKQRFLPDRIRFFVTSSIGFYVDPRTGIYDPDDYQNLVPEEGDGERKLIRGAVHPINVVEPMLWLAGKLSGE